MLTVNQLHIRDLSMQGETLHELWINFPESTITVRELIEQRVRIEFAKYLENQEHSGIEIFEISETEKRLNLGTIGKGDHESEKDQSNDINEAALKKHIADALKGFSNNEYFITVNENQVLSLDDRLQAIDANTVSFMKLIPLMGG